jgi:hypothetical protein
MSRKSSASRSSASASPRTLPGQCTARIADRSPSPRPVLCARCGVVCHSPSPLSHVSLSVLSAAILYVQVEGEAAIAEETLQQTDSVQTVVKRAAEARDIERIDWKDVAGWKLWDSRGKNAKQVASGTSSDRLTKLLPFPDESLLIITRRPPPPPAASSSSSSSSAPGKRALRSQGWYGCTCVGDPLCITHRMLLLCALCLQYGRRRLSLPPLPHRRPSCRS